MRALIASIITGSLLFFLGCHRSPEEKAAKFLESGKAHVYQKDYSRALLDFLNAAQLRPKDAEAYYQIGSTYFARGDFQDALPYINKALQLNPKHRGAQLKLAELMIKSNSKPAFAEAESHANQLVLEDPQDPEALNVLAMAELRQGKIEDAEQHVQAALKRFPSDLRIAATLASAKVAKKDLTGAEQVMREAARQNPKSPDAHEALAQFFVMTNALQLAEEEFQRAVELDSRSGSALMGLATTLHNMGKLDQAEGTFKKLAILPQPEYKFTYAQYLQSRGKNAEMVAEYERIVKAEPNDRLARTHLLEAYALLNRKADVQRVITDALAKNPKDADALLARAGFQMDLGKLTDAQDDLRKVLAYRPESPEAHLLMGKLYQARGQSLLARQELAEAVRLNPEQLTARLTLAKDLLDGGAPKEALRVLSEAPGSQKGSLDLVVQKNWALLASGQAEEFRKGVDAALQAAKSPDVLLQQAVNKVGQKDYAAAVSALREGLRIAPEDTRFLSTLMRTYTLQNRMREGLAIVQQHATDHPKSARVQVFVGEQLLSNKDNAGARSAFLAAKSANPENVTADIDLARLDELEGNRDGARRRLQTVIHSGAGGPRPQMLLAELEIRAGNSNTAAEVYRRMLTSDKNNPIILNNLAYLLATTANADEALKYAQQAKELAPSNTSIDDTLGCILYQKGLYSSAIRYLETGAATGPASRKHHLAMAYYKAGNTQRAQEVFQRALRADSNSPDARRAREVIAPAH